MLGRDACGEPTGLGIGFGAGPRITDAARPRVVSSSLCGCQVACAGSGDTYEVATCVPGFPLPAPCCGGPKGCSGGFWVKQSTLWDLPALQDHQPPVRST